MTIFNGSSSVIAFGPIWEQQYADVIINGLATEIIALAEAGIVILDKNIEGNATRSIVVSPEGSLKLGSRLPRPIGKTCVIIEYDQSCCKL